MRNRIFKKLNGEAFLELAQKPVSGPQLRALGTIREGVFEITRGQQHWHNKARCWYVNYELVKHHEQFGFDVVFLVGTDGAGAKHAGWISAERLITDPEKAAYSQTGYELQIAIRPADLKDLRAEAERDIPKIPEQQLAFAAFDFGDDLIKVTALNGQKWTTI